MLRPRWLTLGAVAVGAAAVALPASSGAGEARRAVPKVTVADDFFAPDAVKIPKGGKVKWVWDDLNTDTHNVVVTSQRPEGVKKSDYHSESAAVATTYAPRFKIPGTYGFVCTFHKGTMRMTVKVKK